MKVTWALAGLFLLFLAILHLGLWVIPHNVFLRHVILSIFVAYAVYEMYKKPKKSKE